MKTETLKKALKRVGRDGDVDFLRTVPSVVATRVQRQTATARRMSALWDAETKQKVTDEINRLRVALYVVEDLLESDQDVPFDPRFDTVVVDPAPKTVKVDVDALPNTERLPDVDPYILQLLYTSRLMLDRLSKMITELPHRDVADSERTRIVDKASVLMDLLFSRTDGHDITALELVTHAEAQELHMAVLARGPVPQGGFGDVSASLDRGQRLTEQMLEDEKLGEEYGDDW